MNYPVWQFGFPGGLLIAAMAVLHVFISHFAVGGGAYLVLTERRAYARNDLELLGYVRHHSKFFALLTVVLGAVTGVGIWFTIGLVSPEATSSLIHTFVWGWAIEWVSLLCRDCGGPHLRLSLGDAGPAHPSHHRLDLFRRGLGKPGGDQRHYYLHAHARTLARNQEFLGWLLQSRLIGRRCLFGVRWQRFSRVSSGS